MASDVEFRGFEGLGFLRFRDCLRKPWGGCSVCVLLRRAVDELRRAGFDLRQRDEEAVRLAFWRKVGDGRCCFDDKTSKDRD